MADERILLKRSGVIGEIPIAAQLEFGELAINYADGAIFTKMADGVVRNISGATASNNKIYVRINGDDNNTGQDEAQAKRTIKAGLNACSPNTTLDIGPGMFLEDNPMPIPQRCTIHGVDQRITSIVPKNPTKDIFWVSTGCYVTGLAYRGHMKPSHCIAFPGNLEIGTAQSSGTGNDTIVLDASQCVAGPGLEDYYREMRIRITGGTGNNQTRTIVSYNTESKMATVNSAWTTPPNSTSTYLIDIAIPETPSPGTRYSSHITASPYLYNMASVVADQYISSSGTSLSISNGSKTITIGTGLSIAAGRWVRIIHDPANFMVGTVVSYTPGTGVLVVQVEKNQRQDISARDSWAVYYVCGGGMEIDGFKAAGLRSMVSAQFTQFNQGGDCVVIKNMGYAQLVSIYAINCEDGFLAESGGTASMGNCNVNFGNRGLVANGVGPLLMTASSGFIFNEAKCERDSGLIVDSVLQDMATDANTQSVFAGLQYWNQAGTTVDVLPLPQKAPTVNTFSYISTLAQKVVQKDTSGTRYQGAVSQNTSASANAATAGEAAIIAARYNNVIDIINNGTVGITDAIVRNSITPNTTISNYDAYVLLQANRGYLQAEANAYVATVETSVSLNTALQTKCSRDVGWITDCVSYDLKYDGNKQSIQAGVYYYGYSNTSAIIDQEPQTVGAYNYLKSLMSYVITNTAVPQLYQTAITQSFSANVATGAQAAIANAYIDTINSIITDGPTNYLQFRYPIPLTVNTNADQIDAVTQLYNNRNFLKKEVIAYVGNVWTSNNQTGYTINVSNVTACTDPRFSITASSKPYLGLVMNIEGTKELDIQAGLGYNVGDTLNVAFVGTGFTDYILGTVTAFDLATTRCTMTVNSYTGTQGNIHTNWVVNTSPTMTTNGRFRQEVILGVDAGEFANVQAGGQLSFIVDTSLEIPKYYTILAANSVGDVTTLLLDERITEPLTKDTKLYFYQKSTLAASGQTFEFVGSGTSVITALPRNGGDLLQANETVSSNGGIVYFTSTDQFGNFRIGEDLLINFNTGTLSGRAFTRSLFAQITPFVLALDS